MSHCFNEIPENKPREYLIPMEEELRTLDKYEDFLKECRRQLIEK